jgi:menaquinone-dependent protoporphyrinogen oxidase
MIMSISILVSYATRFGSTAEIADTIAETLRAKRHTIECRPMADISSLGAYQAILLGSAVNHANWLPGAVDFVKANRDALKLVPVALFTVHIQNTGADELSRRKRLAYLDEVRPYLQPVSEAYFAGRFDRRGAAELMPRWLARIVPKIDRRNWQNIRAWASSLPPLL